MSVPIRDLSPSTFEGHSLRGIVTLRWPYSRSQHALSIQLADEDVAKRASRGQVRISFRGKAADALKDVAIMSSLELSVEADAPKPAFEEIAGTERDIPYKISFLGPVKVRIDGRDELVLDSTPLEAGPSPRKTWQTPELKRSADDLGLGDTWFGQSMDSSKKSRLSFGSNFRYISSTQGTPSATPKQAFSDENTPSQLGQSKMFAFTTPSQPVRPDSQGEGIDLATPIRSRSPVSRFLTQLHPTPPAASTPPVIVEPREEEEVPHSDISRPSSIHGDFDNTKYETHGTPRSSAYTPGHVHFATQQNISAPATPRNVPLLDLASADEQEDLFRKLRASAPPKSDAGSSMVADEDNEEGVLALDTAPSILEKQAQIQEGILRRKISEDSEQPGQSHAQVQDARRAEMKTSTAGDDNDLDRPELPQGQSVAAAYSNSHDGHSVREDPTFMQEAPPAPRQRFASPSMTERGAAVQETIFRSKIVDSDGADEGYARSARSIKSSVMVEPRDGRGSVDGSVHQQAIPTSQPHQTSLLQQQAAVQESLFREKVEHADDHPEERENPSLAGQPAAGPSSNAGDLVPNTEATLLQQQAIVQEDIFRDKVEHQETRPPRPASLDHMEAQPTTPPAVATDSGNGSATFAGTADAMTTAESHGGGSISAILEAPIMPDAPGSVEDELLMDEVAVEDHGDLIDLLQQDEDYVLEDEPAGGELLHEVTIDSNLDEADYYAALGSDANMSDEVGEIVEIEVDAEDSPQGLIRAVLDELEVEDELDLDDMEDVAAEDIDELISIHSDNPPSSDSEVMEGDTDADSAVEDEPAQAASTMEPPISGEFQTQTGLRSPPDSDMPDSDEDMDGTSAIDAAAAEQLEQTPDAGLDSAEAITPSDNAIIEIDDEQSPVANLEQPSDGQASSPAESAQVISDEPTKDASAPEPTVAEPEPQQEEVPPTEPPIQVPGDLTTNVSFYASIEQARPGKVCDMIAICGKAKYDRAKDGPRDRILTGWLFQASNEPLAVTQSSGDVRYIRDARDNPILAARCRFGIFRPFKTALPSVNPGDVLVLREFRMETIGEEPYLRSKDSSSWAVVSFPVYAYSAAALKHASPEDDAALAAQAEVAVSGPPIEYSDEELVHAMRLKRWYEHFGKLVPIVDT